MDGASLTVDQMADDAVAVLDALGWARAHVVGHSLGGLIALNLALRARARVRSLALLCTFARGRDVTSPTPWMIWTGMRTRIGTRRQRRRAFLEMVMTPDERAAANLDAVAAELAPLFGHDLADQPPVVMAQLRAMSSYDASPQLQALAGLPTLVASADSDRIARPELGRTMAAAIPGARYVEFASAAHGVPLRRPAEVNAVLRTHLAAAGD
jgi:pimeloyl-ACP methyl ester carboxylesterase